jgi:hypothetical protein
MLNFGEAQYREVPLIGQPVEKLLRALFCSLLWDRISRFCSVLALFSGSLGPPTGPTPTFSTGCYLLRRWVNKLNKMTQWHIFVPESVKVLPAMGTNFHS